MPGKCPCLRIDVEVQLKKCSRTVFVNACGAVEEREKTIWLQPPLAGMSKIVSLFASQ